LALKMYNSHNILYVCQWNHTICDNCEELAKTFL